jgi:cellulose synthase/poly-beta-1,6-N-acetylglucosamine synthase-like glycosyltransferase
MMFYSAAQIVFWTSALALFYTYAGYPIFVYVINLLFPKRVERADFEPNVTVLITAYNEEKDISSKIKNTLELDYPKEKLEILIASDGSTDKTDEIVKEFNAEDVRLFRQDGRVGKTVTQNNAVEQATGEVILFSDATTMYQPDVLHRMMPNFADKTVGCVAGKLIYVDDSRSNIGKGAKSYWNYETFIKESESRACSLIGASGCLYAVRKSAYKPMYAEACSDFLIATKIYEQGLRSIYEPTAICTEETNRKAGKELQMRVRVISQTFTDLWRNRQMLNPFHSGFFAIELFSHKLLRYAAPLFLILILISTAVIAFSSTFFTLVFVLQIAFYAIALFSWFFERNEKSTGVFAIPLYFVLTNLASLVGFCKFLSGERYTPWEPIRENNKNIRQAT